MSLGELARSAYQISVGLAEKYGEDIFWKDHVGLQ